MADSVTGCRKKSLDEDKDADDAIEIETTSKSSKGTDIDKGWAWLVLFATWMAFVLVGGALSSIGFLYLYMTDWFEDSSTEIAWVGSLYSGLHCLLGPAASCLCNRFGSRHCMIVGGFLVTTGLAVSSQVASLWLMFITLGLIAGSGLGLVHAPLLITPGYYFVRKRNLATGIGVTGFSVGIIVFPVILTALQKQYGWRGGMLLLAGLMSNTCVCGAILRPSTIERQMTVQPGMRTVKNKYQNDTLMRTSHFKLRKDSPIRNIAFCFLCFAFLLSNFSMNIVYVHLPRYATQQQTSSRELHTLFLVIGLAGIMSKLLVGFGTGRIRRGEPLDKMCLLSGAYSILTVAQLLLPSLSYSQYGRLTYAFMIGCYYNVEAPLFVPLTIELVGIKNMSSALGVILFCIGCGFIVGPPVAGFIYLLATVSCLTVMYLSKNKTSTEEDSLHGVEMPRYFEPSVKKMISSSDE